MQRREPRVRRTGRTAGGKVEPLYPRQTKGARSRWSRIFEAVPCVGKEQWKRNRRHVNGYVLWVTVILVLFGLAVIYSTTSFTGDKPLSGVKKQVVFALVELCAMLFLSRLDYHRLLCLSWCQLYTLSIVLLVATLVFGRGSRGRTHWVRLGPASFQPSELMKTALVPFFMVYPANYYYSFSRTPKCVSWTMAVFGGIPAGLIAFQDLSTSFLFGAMVFLITLFGVKDNQMHLGFVIAGAALFFFTMHYYKEFPFLHPYRIVRTESWLNPDANANDNGFRMRLSKYAISAGGWSSASFGREVVKQNGLLEPSVDFIFPVIGEELGMVGMNVLILLYTMLLFYILRIACHTPNRYGALLCDDVAVHILLHIVMCVAVVTGLMPNTDVTLPFISSGDTSLVSFMEEIELVLAVSRGMRPGQLT